jgi:Xaa-Pro aminopeptidase
MPGEIHLRLRRLREQMHRSGADAAIVTHLPNVFYLTGFTGSAGALLIEPNRATLFTDGRYTAQTRIELKSSGVKAQISKGSLPSVVGSHIRAQGTRCASRCL